MKALALALCAVIMAAWTDSGPSAAAASFFPVDVVIDSGDAAMASWQVEVTGLGPDARLVGVEGGDGVWAPPAVYDPAALMADRVVLAAIDQGNMGTTGPARVVRLHLRVVGETDPDIQVIAAGDTEGRRINATATLSKGETP